MAIQDQIQEAAESFINTTGQFTTDAGIFNSVIQGKEGDSVDTEAGSIPTLASAINTTINVLRDQGDSILSNARVARNQAQAARSDAESAADNASSSASQAKNYRDAAQTARGEANSAASTASTAANNAQDYRDDAQDAADIAENKQQSVFNSLNTQKFAGGKLSPMASYTRNGPGAVIFMFTYPNIYATDTPKNVDYNLLDEDFWLRRMLAAINNNPHVHYCVVVNPASGPGEARDEQFTIAIDLLHGAGATVIGYISSDWGGGVGDPDNIEGGGGTGPDTGSGAFYDPFGNVEDYKQLVDDWVSFYPSIDGIWFDEAPFYTADGQDGSPNPNEGDAAFGFYKELYDYVKTEKQLAIVGHNPGQKQFDARYITENAVDFTCMFEQEYDPPVEDLQSTFNNNNSYNTVRKSQLIAMPHNLGELDQVAVNDLLIKFSRFVDWFFYWPNNLYGNDVPWNGTTYADYINRVGEAWQEYLLPPRLQNTS
ncbi:spherulation-specific family 4 protein [Salinisphaera sp.]|uniref:spherulation-specific family 4 protein n=1 Tax=Salinisphaera sp. TaxID=1914330 RepID=UPI000C48AD9F|nr:spherulation-specific family 4 protein [Salinisphaera sp.]MAS09914.1 hypothetical protein [Salinisphaera sp.]MAS09969.1 hypothetical protein [Salinisphaera sp.]|tara:strand:+ start:27027 stop:28481 length:1455 start_codon:yes stop_codon:yes gene_type:complete